MTRLPNDISPYRRTPVFNMTTVPAGLLRDHQTAAGVWGVLHVFEGIVFFRWAEEAEETQIKPGEKWVIPPQTLHSVRLSKDAAFQVEFWR